MHLSQKYFCSHLVPSGPDQKCTRKKNTRLTILPFYVILNFQRIRILLILCFRKGDVPQILNVANIQLEDKDHLIAIVEIDSNKEASFNVISNTDAWLLSGHPRWGFRTTHIKRTVEAEPITIKRSSLMGEHKFAIVGKEAGDENLPKRWCARRYQLEQNKNATIKINSGGLRSGLEVSVLYDDNKHEVLLSPSGDIKVFDQEEVESRRRKINTAMAVAAIVVGIIAIPCGH